MWLISIPFIVIGLLLLFEASYVLFGESDFGNAVLLFGLGLSATMIGLWLGIVLCGEQCVGAS